ncbi:hypothetical protein K435DRAFT_875418 [Dendrothele bispora CBS 962.96]|uniref:Uncharacterized protein n=1 Tax=Dendrothele bispora (strain CBS 962.96) TaxID=1314807 RepID=A0A4S8KUR5_DENBC|nr:hypothetical protein K435DRAFT_875418 [Dendrothele bispora CBS 962.96]
MSSFSSSSSSSPKSNKKGNPFGVLAVGVGRSAQQISSTLQSCISHLEMTLLPGTRQGDAPPDLCELDSSLWSAKTGTQRRKYMSRTASQLTAASASSISTTSSQFSNP